MSRTTIRHHATRTRPAVVTRRGFLKSGLALTAALGLVEWLTPVRQPGFASPELLRLGAAHGALLVTAELAARLIHQGRLAHLAGPPGRAHDPDGAFTTPAGVSVLTVSGADRLRDMLQPGGLWPADARTAVAAALLALGYSPNSESVEALAHAERALVRAQPRFVAEPAQAARATLGRHSLIWRDLGAPQPLDAGLAVEWDWVILADAFDPAAAEDFIRAQRRLVPAFPAFTRTLTPLSDEASFAYQRVYERVQPSPTM